MRDHTLAVLPQLDRAEMSQLIGGDGDPGSSLARDLGYLVGAFFGALTVIWEASPQSSYVYGKVGYIP